MAEKIRDYKQEYREDHGKPEPQMGLKVGDPREADHKNPISKGGSNRKDNLRAVSRHTNRSKGAKQR